MITSLLDPALLFISNKSAAVNNREIRYVLPGDDNKIANFALERMTKRTNLEQSEFDT